MWLSADNGQPENDRAFPQLQRPCSTALILRAAAHRTGGDNPIGLASNYPLVRDQLYSSLPIAAVQAAVNQSRIVLGCCVSVHRNRSCTNDMHPLCCAGRLTNQAGRFTDCPGGTEVPELGGRYTHFRVRCWWLATRECTWDDQQPAYACFGLVCNVLRTLWSRCDGQVDRPSNGTCSRRGWSECVAFDHHWQNQP